jgi:hypothetical protein
MNGSLPRKRRVLWAAHNAASQRMSAALRDYQRDNTAGIRATTSAAVREFVESLPPLIGHEAAFRYEAAWRAWEEATIRAERRHNTMDDSGALDAPDTELSQELDRELADAARAFAGEQIDLKTALEAAWERDEKDGA